MAHHQEQEELVRNLTKKLKGVRQDPKQSHKEEVKLKVKNIVDSHPIHKEEMKPKARSIVDSLSNSAYINKFIIDETGKVEKINDGWKQLLGNILIA